MFDWADIVDDVWRLLDDCVANEWGCCDCAKAKRDDVLDGAVLNDDAKLDVVDDAVAGRESVGMFAIVDVGEIVLDIADAGDTMFDIVDVLLLRPLRLYWTWLLLDDDVWRLMFDVDTMFAKLGDGMVLWLLKLVGIWDGKHAKLFDGWLAVDDVEAVLNDVVPDDAKLGDWWLKLLKLKYGGVIEEELVLEFVFGE